LRPHPARRLAAAVLRERELKEIGDRALLDHESAVHVAFADGEFGVEEDGEFSGPCREADGDRCAGAISELKDGAAGHRQAQRSAPNERLQHDLQRALHQPPQTTTPSGPAAAADSLGTTAANTLRIGGLPLHGGRSASCNKHH